METRFDGFLFLVVSQACEGPLFDDQPSVRSLIIE